MRSISVSPPKKTRQPAKKPPTTHPWPDDFSIASWTRSNESALISTPAPKAMISPIQRRLMRNSSAMTDPMTSEDAASVPQPKAAPISAFLARRGYRRGYASGSISLGRQVLSKNGSSGL